MKSRSPFHGTLCCKLADAARTISWREQRGWGTRHDILRESLTSEIHHRHLTLLCPIELAIRDEPIEHLAVAHRGGLDRRLGDSLSVMIDHDQIAKWRVDGHAVLTHNHLSGQSFSLSDVATAEHAELVEIRAVTPYGVWSMRRPSAGWGHVNGFLKHYIDVLVTGPAHRTMHRHVHAHGYSREAWLAALVKATHAHLHPAMVREFGADFSYQRWADRLTHGISRSVRGSVQEANHTESNSRTENPWMIR